MNIASITSVLHNVLSAANTTTAANDLSSRLNNRVNKIYKGIAGMHEDLPVAFVYYPAVFVEADKANFEPRQIGNNARRKAEIHFSIVCVTHYGLGSGDSGTGRQNADMEALQMANNVEQIIHNDITLSGTVQWIFVDDSEYEADISDSGYNSIVAVNLKGNVTQ